MSRAPRLLLVLALALSGLTLASQPAAATAVSVGTEAQYRAALTSLSADNSGPHTITLTADIVIDDGTDPTYSGPQPLTIVGNGFALDGTESSRVLHRAAAGAPLLVLQDVTVRNGRAATENGGGVRWDGPGVIDGGGLLDNATSGTGLRAGGGAYFEGDVSITDAVIEGNVAESTSANAIGGGVLADGGGDITVLRSVIRGNRAESATNSPVGGGITTVGSVTITQSVLNQNTAIGQGAGGGAVRSGEQIQVDGSWLWDNYAEAASGVASGGALYAPGLPVNVLNTTIEENQVYGTTTSQGAAIDGGAVSLEDSTVGENIASGGTERAAVFATTLTAHQTTIAANVGSTVANVQATTLTGTTSAIGQPVDGPNCQVTTSTMTHSIDDDGTCGLDGGEGNVSDGPDLALGGVRDNGGPGIPVPDPEPEESAEAGTDPFPTRTMFPLAGSPVLDHVPAADCWDDLDQRGIERPYGAACEAGAVEGVFAPHPFSDVPPWVEEAVRWLASDVNDPVLITGITPTTFRPNDPITRGQVVRMLHREAGAPDGYPPHPFSDVPAWVEEAVRWAFDEEIVTGITPTLFKPNDPITRAQVVRMKYRFAGSQDVSGVDDHPFTDVPAWVEDAVTWAANPDLPVPLVTGITPTTFRPNDPITRAQVARMDYRLALSPAAWSDPQQAPFPMIFTAGDSQ